MLALLQLGQSYCKPNVAAVKRIDPFENVLMAAKAEIEETHEGGHQGVGLIGFDKFPGFEVETLIT